jgi:hypothetical protein
MVSVHHFVCVWFEVAAGWRHYVILDPLGSPRIRLANLVSVMVGEISGATVRLSWSSIRMVLKRQCGLRERLVGAV